jgi:hypothetical protein
VAEQLDQAAEHLRELVAHAHTEDTMMVTEDASGNVVLYVEREAPVSGAFAHVLFEADRATEADARLVAALWRSRRALAEVLSTHSRVDGWVTDELVALADSLLHEPAPAEGQRRG